MKFEKKFDALSISHNMCTPCRLLRHRVFSPGAETALTSTDGEQRSEMEARTRQPLSDSGTAFLNTHIYFLTQDYYEYAT